MKKVFNNFADFGKSLGVRIKRKPAKPEEIRKCRKCGAIMSKVDNTNIYVCTGENCKNRAIERIHGFNGEGSLCYVPRKKDKSRAAKQEN